MMLNDKQINLAMPSVWHEQLERIARLASVKEDRTLSHLDLIRRAIKEKYNLPDVVKQPEKKNAK